LGAAACAGQRSRRSRRGVRVRVPRRHRFRWIRRRPRPPFRSASYRPPGQLELADAEVAAAEAGLAVGEVELPHAAEGLVEALGVDAGPLVEEAFPPQAQGPGVVRPELAVSRHAQRGVGREGVVDRLPGWDDAAGEDVLLDPAEAAPGGEET